VRPPGNSTTAASLASDRRPERVSAAPAGRWRHWRRSACHPAAEHGREL